MLFNFKGLYSKGLYRPFFDFVFQHTESCSLVVRKMSSLEERGQAFLKTASSELIRTSNQSEWPGTRLIFDKAVIYTFNLSPEFRRLFQDQADDLGAWLNPTLPEDPAFYRRDGSVLFGSVTHERDAFAELTDAETAECRKVIGMENLLKTGGIMPD